MVKGDETFELWKKPDAEVYLKVYIFNITNREAFLAGEEAKLKFQQVGPYVYRYVKFQVHREKPYVRTVDFV